MRFNGRRSNNPCDANGGTDSRADCYRNAHHTDCYGDTKTNADIGTSTDTCSDASAPTDDASTARLDAAYP